MTPKTMRLLICGVTGMIGHKMWQTLSQSHDDVVGTVHRGRDEVAGHGIFGDRIVEHFEASNAEVVKTILDQVHPNVIVNCVGITKRKPEADDVARTFAVNTLFPHLLAGWAARHGSRVIHFSTDCVFDGDDGNYDDRSVVTAKDLYGQTKFFGELDYSHCLTIRTSMIGRELTGKTELLEWFLAQSGKIVKGFTNAAYSGLTTNEMAKMLGRIINDHSELSGKYQISGPVISKYALLCKLRDAFGTDAKVVPDSGFACDRTLQSHRFKKATGITVPSWDDMLTELTADRTFYDRPARTTER